MSTVKRAKLTDLSFEVIQAHILDPKNNPLPECNKEQFDRVITAARLLDDYPNESDIVKIMLKKYNVAQWTINRDIHLAQMVYKTKHTFDWHFWHIWQIRDQLKLIALAQKRNDLKAWNEAKKVLHKIIGEKPEAIDDPNRMGKNQFYIQVNVGGSMEFKPVEDVQGLKPKELKEIIDIMQQPIDEAEAEEIMNT